MPDIAPIQPLLLNELSRFDVIDKVILDSLEQALYRVEVEVADQRYYLIESPGKSLTRRSIVEIQALLIPFKVTAMYLKHSSPYDEMIGHEVSAHSNQLLVPLGNYFEGAAEATRH